MMNFYFLLLSLLIFLILMFLQKTNYFQFFFKNYSMFIFMKLFSNLVFLLSFMFISLVFMLFIFNVYMYYNVLIYNGFFTILKFFSVFQFNLFYFMMKMNFSIDMFGFILLFLSYFVGFFTLISLDSRLYWQFISYMFIFLLFILIVYMFVSSTNMILFFMFYELLLFPSFLFVFFVSPSSSAIQSSFYFLIWTQIGSFMVLIAMMYMMYMSGSLSFFFMSNFKFLEMEMFFIYFLLFLGFGMKVPIWPFHYWLTKTHVEAPSGFSMYLSGFLVKTALYGFLKMTNLFSFFFSTSIFFMICFLGIIDSSMKMWGQTDLKKLVAYCTIQEMNFIFLLLVFGDSFLKEISFLFCITHAILSSLMFYIVDCIYSSFHSSSMFQMNGIFIYTPNLAIFIFIMCIFFAGLPGTLKFSVEFCIFSNIINISSLMNIILMFSTNFLGVVGFSKNWFNCMFGLKKKKMKNFPLDLSSNEVYMIMTNFFFLLIFSFLCNIIF